MSLTLGEKLRQAREERGISVSEVAEQTRISPLYLESIEKDEFKILPGGIFNKGFVKSYAKYVGVDENEALQDYAKQVAGNEAAAAEEFRSYRPEVLTDDRAISSIVPTVIFAGIILALMTGGILFVVNYIQNQQAEPETNLTASSSNANTPAANVALNTNTAPSSATQQIDVELKAVGEPVWVSYSVDGTKSEQTLAANESLKAQAKDSFTASYSRSRATNLQVFLNGRRIQVPDNGSRGSVEIEITKDNLAQLLQSAETPSSRPAAADTPDAAPRETPAQQTSQAQQPAANATAAPPVTKATAPAPKATEKVNNASPKPRTPSPEPIGTPIVIGRPSPEGSPQ